MAYTFHCHRYTEGKRIIRFEKISQKMSMKKVCSRGSTTTTSSQVPAIPGAAYFEIITHVLVRHIMNRFDLPGLTMHLNTDSAPAAWEACSPRQFTPWSLCIAKCAAGVLGHGYHYKGNSHYLMINDVGTNENLTHMKPTSTPHSFSATTLLCWLQFLVRTVEFLKNSSWHPTHIVLGK